MRRPAFFVLLLWLMSASTTMPDGETTHIGLPWAWEGITELRPGDILVRSNLNLLPGSSVVEGGLGFGHAAMVSLGGSHRHPDSLLKRVMVLESHAGDVPGNLQVREIQGLVSHVNPSRNNTAFAGEYRGRRYRLRLDLLPEEVDQILQYVRAQMGTSSSWMASKPADGEAVTHWYCSLLVWKAVLEATGIDLDANQGYYVYPNDLINSPYFDNRPGVKGRTRF